MRRLWAGMVRIGAVLTVCALAACGADGEPEPPTKNIGIGFSTGPGGPSGDVPGPLRRQGF